MVHYIGYFVDEKNSDLYSYNVPGLKKMDYVVSSLMKTGFDVNIFSICRTKKAGFRRKKKCIRGKHLNIIYRASCSGGKIGKLADKILLSLELFFFVMLHVKKDDTVIVYHSVRSTEILAKLISLRKAHWILEVEELYGFGATYDNPRVGREIENINKFQKHIFVNNLLPDFLGIKENYTVCYGAYDLKERQERDNDGKIRVVYAGTIEQSKVGAYTAVEAAGYLSGEYELHIAGFGTEQSVSKLKKMIDENNSKNACRIYYHGKLDGDQLSQLLFSCDIGVSTYVIRLPFSNCVFPSKLTTYVCHGLKVVIGRSENFERAEIALGWVYYDKNDPEDIAQSIKKASEQEKTDCSALIRRLDTTFKKWLKENIRR